MAVLLMGYTTGFIVTFILFAYLKAFQAKRYNINIFKDASDAEVGMGALFVSTCWPIVLLGAWGFIVLWGSGKGFRWLMKRMS